MIERNGLTLVRFFEPDRYVLQRPDGQELVVLPDGLPGDGEVNGRGVRVTVSRRGRRTAIAVSDQRAELGSIQLSWIPGRYRIELERSELRAIRRWIRGDWSIVRDGERIATLETNGWFRSSLGMKGRNQIEAGYVVLTGHLSLDADLVLALLLVFEMITYDIPVPVASAGG
jgi:hypothetical protein